MSKEEIYKYLLEQINKIAKEDRACECGQGIDDTDCFTCADRDCCLAWAVIKKSSEVFE